MTTSSSIPLITISDSFGTVAFIKRPIRWAMTAGVEPHITSFVVPAGPINESVKALQNPVSLKWELNGSIDGQPSITHTLEIKNLYLTEPKEVDKFTVLWQIADVRFALRGKKVYGGYNITRVKNAIATSVSAAPDDPSVMRASYDTFKTGRYVKNSLKTVDETTFTVTEILQDVLSKIDVAEVDFPDPSVSQGDFLQENVVFEGEDIYAVLQDLLKKSRLNMYVNLDGVVCIYSIDFFDESVIDAIKSQKTIAPGKIYVQDLSRIRPPTINVTFQNITETIVVAVAQDSFEIVAGARPIAPFALTPTDVIKQDMIDNRTAIACMNVIQVPFVPAALAGVYHIGEYAPIMNYVADLGFDSTNEEIVRKLWWTDALERQISFLFQAGGALTLEIETLAYQIGSAIRSSYRQLWMIDPYHTDNIKFWEDRRNTVVDNFSGYRPPAPVWADYAMVPKIRNPEISQRRALHTIGVRNWKVNENDPTRTRPTLGRVRVVDQELGVFRIEYPSDKDGIIAQIIPSAVLNPPQINFADVTSLNDIMLTFQSPLDPSFTMEAMVSVAWNFGRDDKFDSEFKYTSIEFDYRGNFTCLGVPIEIYCSKELARLDKDLVCANTAVLNAIAEGEAIRAFNQFKDRSVGYTIIPGFYETIITGNINSIEYSIDTSLGAHTKVDMISVPPAPELVTILPDSVRQYLYKQLGAAKD